MSKHAKRNAPTPNPPLDPDKKLYPAALARLLSSAGDPVEASTIRDHIGQGAPADGRKRMSLADYAAWLALRVASETN